MTLVKDVCPICFGAKVIFIGTQAELEESSQTVEGKECECPKCKGEGFILVEDEDDDDES